VELSNVPQLGQSLLKELHTASQLQQTFRFIH